MHTGFISHPDCAAHVVGSGHPECPERLAAINDRVLASGLEAFLAVYEAPLATDEQILRAHAPSYLARLRAAAPEHGIRHLDADTAMSPGSLPAALRAAGAGVLATDLVIAGQVSNAFCAVRPPGHHAEPDKAMGFCLLGNVAIAALHALEYHGLERVAVIDFDVHHGNGTEAILAGDERVLMVGAFQHPFYPYSGTDAAAINIRNIPMPAGTRGEAYRSIVQRQWLPALHAHQPQMLFVSAGFDAHVEDDMASCGLVEADYAWITEQICDVADTYCSGRIVSMLEGGYALSALGRSAEVHLRMLAGL